MTEESGKLEETRASLRRIQQYNSELISRRDVLGEAFSFEEIKPHVDQVIGLFGQIPEGQMHVLPEKQLKILKGELDSFFNILEEIQKFSAGQSDAVSVRRNIIDQVSGMYAGFFSSATQIISYLQVRSVDFSRLERDARASIQAVRDEGDKLSSDLKLYEDQARETLETIRSIAAEQGVSQQASYFADQMAYHEKQAGMWRLWTLISAGGVITYAVLALLSVQFKVFTILTDYDLIQLSAAKLAIFIVLVFLMTLFAKNFLNHNHNLIVNKHRQNALLTYKALVDAAGTSEGQEIILSQAAMCIFAPQETGFSRGAQLPASIGQNISHFIPRPNGTAASTNP